MSSGRLLAAVHTPLSHLSAAATPSCLPALVKRCISSVALLAEVAVQQGVATHTAATAAAACSTTATACPSFTSQLHHTHTGILPNAHLQPCCFLRTTAVGLWPTGRLLPVAHAFQTGSRGYACTAAADEGKEPMDAQDIKAITRSIRDARSLQQLAHIVKQSASSFNAIHTAAAFTKAARLAGRSASRTETGRRLLQELTVTWQEVLHQATVRELSNCLWACAKLHIDNPELWNSSISAALQQLGPDANGHDLSNIAYALAVMSDSGSGTPVPAPVSKQQAAELLGKVTSLLTLLVDGQVPGGEPARNISTVLWANAKLGVVPAVNEVETLLQGLTPQQRTEAAPIDPSFSSAAAAQSVANTLWAVSEFQQLSGASLKLQEGLWRQLLSSQQLQEIAAGGPHAVSSTLRALGLLATAEGHTLAVPFAQECAAQLLQGPSAQQISYWRPVDIAAAVFGCGKIGVKDPPFLQSMAGAAPDWLPAASAANLSQIAWACAKLRFRHPQLIEAFVHQGKQLMHGSRHDGHDVTPSAEDRVVLAATVSWTVAVLNFNHLAGDVRALLVSSGIKHMQVSFSAAVARMLWRVHSWLLHQHVGGHGLIKLLTEQQLAACAAATRHSHRSMPQQQQMTAGAEHPHLQQHLQEQQQQQQEQQQQQ